MNFPSFLMPTTSGLRRIIGLLALAAMLAGCSAIKLGYNNLDDIAYWWLDSYVDFSDEQTSRVREDLAGLHAWHRKEELPPVIAMLQEIERLAPGDVTPAQACAYVQQARERVNALTERAEPAAITLSIGLTADQLKHLERKYEKNDAEYRKQWVRIPRQEQKEKRYDQFLERGEMIYGKLDEPQKAVLRKLVEQSMFEPEKMLAERIRRQQDALQTLRKMAAQPIAFGDARTLLRGYLERVQQPPEPAARRYQDGLIEEGCRNISVLHNSTSTAQREAAVRRLRAYQRDLRDLVRDK
ncbi:MAG: DUF6279 family lipoprotein [Ramlibacter sp.]